MRGWLRTGCQVPPAKARAASIPQPHPTLNAKGELVGLLFDGTYESVASNFLFDPVATRSVHVDARYMLWNMTEVDGALHLLREMLGD